MVFVIAKITPGDPVTSMLGTNATPERVAELRKQLHLDDPFYIQYGRFLWNILHGDLGRSYRGNTSVALNLAKRLPSTLELALSAFILTISIGLPAGVLAAKHQGNFIDRAIMVVGMAGISIPSFYLGILLIILFGVELNWVSVTGGEGFSNLILPAVCLAVGPTGVLARFTRTSMLETISKNFVRTARGKGLPEKTVLTRHVLRNGFIPIVTYLGLLSVNLITGAIFIETVFARPGFGRFMVTAIAARDYPQVQGAVLIVATAFVLINLVVDLLYGLIDPRIGMTNIMD
jgi:ABC-type dipeptide/oligopeptide/nickel transport system permease component